MNIEKINKDGNITLIPDGRLDSLTAGEFEEVVNDALSWDFNSLTIDMKGVDFVSSKGLRVLVGAYKKLNGKDMYLEHVNSSIMEVLKLSGLLKVFKINENS